MHCTLIDKIVNTLFAGYELKREKNKQNFIATKKGQQDMVKSGRERNLGIRAKKFDKAHVPPTLIIIWKYV